MFSILYCSIGSSDCVGTLVIKTSQGKWYSIAITSKEGAEFCNR